MREILYPITPVAKPRMTQRDKWAKRPAVVKYHKFKDQCREDDVSVRSGDHIVFMVPMPASWSKKKKLEMAFEPHKQRPDLDNLLKALFDACLDEDSHISEISAAKIWSLNGGISIVRPDDEH